MITDAQTAAWARELSATEEQRALAKRADAQLEVGESLLAPALWTEAELTAAAQAAAPVKPPRKPRAKKERAA